MSLIRSKFLLGLACFLYKLMDDVSISGLLGYEKNMLTNSKKNYLK